MLISSEAVVMHKTSLWAASQNVYPNLVVYGVGLRASPVGSHPSELSNLTERCHYLVGSISGAERVTLIAFLRFCCLSQELGISAD